MFASGAHDGVVAFEHFALDEALEGLLERLLVLDIQAHHIKRLITLASVIAALLDGSACVKFKFKLGKSRQRTRGMSW